MNLSLSGKLAIICGSSTGIGKAAAFALASLGASTILVARSEEKLRQNVAQLPRIEKGQSHDYLAADFLNVIDLERSVREKLLAQNGRPVHILVNNAGGPPPGQLIDLGTNQLQAAINIHLLASHVMTRAVVDGMKREAYGRIINVISISAKAPHANLGVSNVVRGAMANHGKTLANELAVYGITVNNVLPGYTDTARLGDVFRQRAHAEGKSVESVVDELREKIPARRIGKPEDLANVIAFLATPAASYVNGINVPVDGGLLPCL